MKTRPNAQQRLLLAAIRAGRTTLRDLMHAGGYSSTSAVKYNLELLAADGHVVLEQTPRGLEVWSGREFTAAWDAAARLGGNPDA